MLRLITLLSSSSSVWMPPSPLFLVSVVCARVSGPGMPGARREESPGPRHQPVVPTHRPQSRSEEERRNIEQRTLDTNIITQPGDMYQ